jgi:hypothetical protein
VVPLPRAISKEGRRRDRSSARGVQLALEPPDFMRRLDGPRLDGRSDVHTTSDASGAFALPRCADIPGARIVGRLDGFETAVVEAQPGTDLGILVEMRTRQPEVGEIRGRVVDAGNAAVAEAFVSLGERTAVTDSRGEFRLETVGAEAALDLVAIHPGFLPGRFHAEKDLATGAPIWPAEVVLALGGLPLSIRGTVVDGEASRGTARIWLEDPTRFGVLGGTTGRRSSPLIAGPGMDGDNYWRSTSTNADGAFELAGLVDREYKVGLLDARTLDLPDGPFAAGARDVRIVFETAAARRIEGHVKSTRGAPVPGVALDLMRPTFGGISMSFDKGVRVSDAEGKYAFEEVRDGAARVGARRRRRSDDDSVRAIGEEGFTITVAVRCHFKVHLSGEMAAADRLRVLDAEGAEMDLMDITPSGVTTMKHASIVSGRSASLGVAEQAWTLSILKNDAEILRRDLRLVPGILNVIEL